MSKARDAVGADPADAALTAGRALSSDTAIREAEAWLMRLQATDAELRPKRDESPSGSCLGGAGSRNARKPDQDQA